MISRAVYDAYCQAVDNLTRTAAATVESRILEWVRAHPGAAVAEIREAATAIMDALVPTYDDAAATLAADWYDGLAAKAGKKLPAAITETAYTGGRTAEVARYQAGKLAKGDTAGFARYCGEYAANDAKLALNQTIMGNARRDRRKGVRYARIPSGLETCTWCMMLASRGAVYYTRATAGEWNHWHRHCACKVVPGFEADQKATLVEGHSPKQAEAMWSRFRDIDDYKVPSTTRAALKQQAVLGGEPFDSLLRRYRVPDGRAEGVAGADEAPGVVRAIFEALMAEEPTEAEGGGYESRATATVAGQSVRLLCRWADKDGMLKLSSVTVEQ